ncbi:MAG: exodeoxyribonuclease VII large subunit [Rickettsiales bacterium]|jgi:exodeoxyribonuclease VII large subunit|nr:exodeoxyribonuclease VII large subunit [Rickettsiales bacterium]
MTEQTQIFSVTEISQMLRGAVERAFPCVKVRGELSGITRAASGHTYLSVKDADSVINGIIWRGTAVNFDLADGLEVIATGKITTYPARSNYQLIISEIEIAGAGAILKMLEERKRKLAAEGLFDASRKKPLPRFPKKIGIVTSPTGAALQDIRNKLRDRLPAELILYPAQVQGASAAAEVAAGLAYFNLHKNVDVIIVARGGGAIEDLLPFSEEVVVRAVAASEIPVISGVGHDPDWMLIDFAADVRAPTPTGAAEIVVPTKQSLTDELEKLARILKNSLITRLQNAAMRLDSIMLRSPAQMISDHRARLADLWHLLGVNWQNHITYHVSHVAHLGQMLESLSYKNVLRRGYAIVRKGEKIISAKKDFSVPATIEFADGIANV